MFKISFLLCLCISLSQNALLSAENNIFQQAQTSESQGNFEEALLLYKQCAEINDNKEETWSSCYQLGEIYKGQGLWDQALNWYLKAYEKSPDRAEPLFKIAQHYRLLCQNNLACLYAIQGSRISQPREFYSSFTPSIYEYGLDEEISIAAFYTRYKEQGRAAADRLILKKGIPTDVKNQASKNMVYYAPFLPHTTIQKLQINLPQVGEGMEETYLPCNPSIRKTDQGYRVICRTVNCTFDCPEGFKLLNPLDNRLRTRNFIIDYDLNLQHVSQKEIIEKFPRKWDSFYQGLEECRIISDGQNDCFTCASIGTHPQETGQSFCRLGCGDSNTEMIVKELIPIKKPIAERREKNWLPFFFENELLMIYGYDPFTIYKIDQKTGDCETKISYPVAHDLTHFKGSAGPIEFEQGYLVVVHESVKIDRLYYTHRFLQLDKNFKIIALTKPFFFKQKGIEYCCGMTIDHSKTNLILTIGIEDREAYFVTLKLSTVKELLEPLP